MKAEAAPQCTAHQPKSGNLEKTCFGRIEIDNNFKEIESNNLKLEV